MPGPIVTMVKMSRALEALDASVRRLEEGELSALELLDELLGEEHATREHGASNRR